MNEPRFKVGDCITLKRYLTDVKFYHDSLMFFFIIDRIDERGYRNKTGGLVVFDHAEKNPFYQLQSIPLYQDLIEIRTDEET